MDTRNATPRAASVTYDCKTCEDAAVRRHIEKYGAGVPDAEQRARATLTGTVPCTCSLINTAGGIIGDGTSANPVSLAPIAPFSLLANPTSASAVPIGVPVVATGGLSAAFQQQPPTSDGLYALFDADNIPGADGSTVTIWRDTSGSNLAAVPGSGTSILRTNVVNGHNAVEWTVGSDWMSLPLDPASWIGLSIYMVSRTPDAQPNATILSWVSDGQLAWFGIGSDPSNAAGTTAFPPVDLGPTIGYAANRMLKNPAQGIDSPAPV